MAHLQELLPTLVASQLVFVSSFRPADFDPLLDPQRFALRVHPRDVRLHRSFLREPDLAVGTLIVLFVHVSLHVCQD